MSQIAAELYALAPAQFTAARDEQARRAKAAGQSEVAAAVKKLARPTASAWLVNQLVRTEPAKLGRLFELADSLQDAQRELAGDRLRELSGQRRQVIADLLAASGAVAEAAGQQLSPAVLAEVRSTLEAAIADPAAGAAVRSGQLTRALAYAGLGGVDLTAAVATPVTQGARRSTPGTTDKEAPASNAQRTAAGRGRAGAAPRTDRAAAAAQAVSGAEAAEQAAARTAEAAQQDVTRLGEQRLFHQRRIEHLRVEMRQADAEDAGLARDEARAKRARDAAERALATARRRLAQARQRAGPD